MTKNEKLILFDAFILSVSIFGGYLFINRYINYALIVLAIAIAFLIQELMYRFTKDKESEKVILVNKIEDLIDAQMELRKMIYYFKQTDNCSFVLFDQNQAIIFILKKNEDTLSPIEIEINNNRIKNKNRSDIDEEMLNEISKTTIIKLPNDKAFKISPVKKQDNLKKETEEENLI